MQPSIMFLLLGTALAYPSMEIRAANSTSNSTCNSQQAALLADGIQRNIDLQMKEMQSLKTLQYLATTANTILRAANSTSGSDPVYKVQQSEVAKLQQEAIQIRTENQKIAQGMNSPSSLQKGLASVAIEQNMAKVQLKGLVAGKNDTEVLNMLVKGAEDGMKLNEENLKTAKSGNGCGK